jgi:hypothetical protein
LGPIQNCSSYSISIDEKGNKQRIFWNWYYILFLWYYAVPSTDGWVQCISVSELKFVPCACRILKDTAAGRIIELRKKTKLSQAAFVAVINDRHLKMPCRGCNKPVMKFWDIGYLGSGFQEHH